MGDSTLRTYRKWVIAAGIYNLFFGLPLLLPVVFKQYYKSTNQLQRLLHLGGKEAAPPAEGINKLLINFTGLLLTVIGFQLFYAALDLKNRVGVPVITAFARLIAVAMILYYTTTENISRVMAVFSVLDFSFAIALLYYAGKIRKLGRKRAVE